MSILKSHQSYETTKLIWGIKCNPEKNIIALELRNVEDQILEHVIIDGEFDTLQPISIDLPYLSQLEKLNDDFLIFSTYEENEEPIKKDVILFNYNTEEINTYLDHRIESFDQKGLLLTDQKTDQTESIETYPLNEDSILFPFHYDLESEHLKTVKNFLHFHNIEGDLHCADYLENDNNVLISVFLKQEESLNSKLIIANEEGEIQHIISSGENLSGLAFDTFFLMNQRVYYIENKNKLCSFQL